MTLSIPMLFLRVTQLACAAGMIFAARVPPRPPEHVELALSLLGENELPDGSWQGVDLLATPQARAQRVQLNLRPARDLRVTLDARAPDGSLQRIFPEPGKSGVLARGQSYALPGPRAFFEIDGEAALVLSAEPARGSTLPPALASLPAGASLRAGAALPLSDGARFSLGEATLATTGPLRSELRFRAR